jgi:hypothetical protein
MVKTAQFSSPTLRGAGPIPQTADEGFPVAKSQDEVILDCLKKAINALPELLPLVGTKSIFSAKQADLAQRALHEGLLITHQKQVKSGKTTKVVDVGILTEAGARKVADAGGTQSLKNVLEMLQSTLERLGGPRTAPDPTKFSAVVEKATTICVNAINTAFAGLQADVLSAVSSSSGASVDPAPLLAGIAAALSKIEPNIVKVPVVAEQIAVAPNPEPLKAIENEIVSFVTAKEKAQSVGCDFVEMFDHLLTKQPNLSIGAFHDALRAMDAAGRIRLQDWPGSQDDIPRPELALFISHTVMYHVQPTR